MELRRSVITGETCACTAIMADRTTLDQYIALLPERSAYAPTDPLGCHRPRISDRIVFDKMLQLLRFGCSYQAIADATCSATTIRNRRDEWIRLGVFAELKQITLGGPRPRHRSAGAPRDSHLRRNPLPDGCSSDLTKPRSPCTFSARRTATPFEAGAG
jgi:transposase